MLINLLIHGLALLDFAAALENPHRKRALIPERVRPILAKDAPVEKRQVSQFTNSKTKQYVVDGRGLPDVDFDIGESYAGMHIIIHTSLRCARLTFIQVLCQSRPMPKIRIDCGSGSFLVPIPQVCNTSRWSRSCLLIMRNSFK